jgi:hypothetical protein
MDNKQWAMDNKQWAMGDRQWAMGKYALLIVYCKIALCKLLIEN